jgi:transmembrane sensor
MTMGFDFRDIEKLLPGYLAGELTEGDRAVVDAWRASEPRNESIYQETLKAWESMTLLHHMEQFNSFEALHKVNNRIEKQRSVNWWQYGQRIAALLLLPLLAYSGFVTLKNLSLKESQKDFVVMQTISSRQGMVTSFVLADGTKVWLNSGSELKFPSRFTGDERTVALKGEGYFEVTKNQDQPFRVNTKELAVDVLGTSFDVVSYEDDQQFEIILVEGSVKLTDGKLSSKTAPIVMHPGQRAVLELENRKVDVANVEVEKYIAWRDGNLVFRDDNMEEVVRRLSRWYNTEIVINDPEIKDYVYKATFRNESLPQVLNLLKLSAPIDYKIVASRALPNGEFTREKVFLMKKKK